MPQDNPKANSEIDMKKHYAEMCAQGNHRIGHNLVDSGHGARPSGPQVCLMCGRTLAELFAAERKRGEEQGEANGRRKSLEDRMALLDVIQEYVVAHSYDTTVGRRIDAYIDELMAFLKAELAALDAGKGE